ncbi:uncharacterized protein LOC127704294 [Mytilus californianus]|uniref:uncharacterized protein LOC127704294 n=1 Tax=Mytilus californianus TaxID=6549 RepID=UPI0022460A5A|nr:uncharacterized protein LOC127704294 [Mytilus californianus]
MFISPVASIYHNKHATTTNENRHGRSSCINKKSNERRGIYKQPSFLSRTIILMVLLLKDAYQIKGAECLVNWKIITKAIVIGEETKLECDIRDTITCPGIPRWTGGPENQIITVGKSVFHPQKYGLTRSPGKYILTIRNIGKEDLNSRYSCHVRFSKYEALLKDKNPTYSLKFAEPKSLQEDLRIFANISAFPVNRNESQHVWLRYPVNNATNKKELQISKKFQEKVEDDGISLTVKNLSKRDISMTYELLYNNATFSADVTLSLKSNDVSHKSSFDQVELEWLFIPAGVIVPLLLLIKHVYRKYKEKKKSTRTNQTTNNDDILLKNGEEA